MQQESANSLAVVSATNFLAMLNGNEVSQQVYALKKVKIGAQSLKDKENAINEVRILSSIRHPNVVEYKEAFIDNESQSLK